MQKNERQIFIQSLQPFIMTHQFLETNCSAPSSPPKRQSIEFLSNSDSLFWCFYICKYGTMKYDMIGNHYYEIEKEEKIKYLEMFRTEQCKHILKMYKIKPLCELEDDLSVKKNIGIKTFMAMCLVENLNALVVSGRKYYEIYREENKDISIITKERDVYRYNFNDDNEKKIIEIRQTLYKVEQELKAISAYKVEELNDLAKRLGICLEGKMLKKNIYEKIVLALS